MNEYYQPGDDLEITASAPVDERNVDAGAAADEVSDGLARAGSGQSFFGQSGPPERRVSQRYRARDVRGLIGWTEGGVFRQRNAWIVDISATGSLIATDVPPPLDRSIWLRLDNPAVPAWAEAKVLRIHTNASGLHAARLAFEGTCPYELIKGVAFALRPPGASTVGPGVS
jgi:hypothetical protein